MADRERSGAGAAPRHPRGHQLVRHASDCTVEAWASDRSCCLTEALAGLVESFADVPEEAVTGEWPLGVAASGAGDQLVSLFEDVIDALGVFGVVPVRFHLTEAEDGGIAGDMEVVSADKVHVVGPLPKGVCHHGASMTRVGAQWRCHVRVDA